MPLNKPFTTHDMQAGKPFNYTGTFMRLKQKPMQLNKRDQCFTDADGINYDLLHINEGNFILYNRMFGRISILFKECQHPVEQPINQ